MTRKPRSSTTSPCDAAKAGATHFGTSVASLLHHRGITQEQLAETTGMSQPYTNQIVNGRRIASSRWADLVADALALTATERAKLHGAAAKDNGFKIDLPSFE